MHFLDLPNINSQPSYADVQSALDELSSSSVVDFEATDSLDRGTRQWLSRLAMSELDWLPYEEAERLRTQASRRISQECGVTATASQKRTIDLGEGKSVLLFEPGMTGDNLGQLTWGSSLILSRRLVRQPELVRSLRVIELGAGTGLVGITAKIEGASFVHLTDLPEIVPNLAHNIALNSIECASYSLDWSDPQYPPEIASESKTQQRKPVFDVCLISDPVYSSEHPAMLLKTVAFVGASSVLLQLPLRNGFETERQQIWDGLPNIGYEMTSKVQENGRDLFGEQEFSYTRWEMRNPA